MNSIEYSSLESTDKRALVIDYFFKKHNELNKFTYIKPKDFKEEYNLNSNQHRTLNRNFEWLYYKSFLISILDIIDENKCYHTDFKIDDRKIKYNIPSDEKKRLHYATLLAALLSSSPKFMDIKHINYYEETAIKGMDLTTKLTDGVVRDVLLASKIYEYYKCGKGSLLNIVAELSHFEQSIQIEFKDGTLIRNGIIKSIGIYEEGGIELVINRMTLELDNINEITNIFILSKDYPSSNVGLPSMNTKILLDSLKTQKNYNKMNELYIENCIDTDIENDTLEKFIQRLCKHTDDCLSLTERANRRIKIID